MCYCEFELTLVSLFNSQLVLNFRTWTIVISKLVVDASQVTVRPLCCDFTLENRSASCPAKCTIWGLHICCVKKRGGHRRFTEMRKETSTEAKEGGRCLEMLFRLMLVETHYWMDEQGCFSWGCHFAYVTKLSLSRLWTSTDDKGCSRSLTTWERFPVVGSRADLWLGPVQLLHQWLRSAIGKTFL